MNVLTIPQFFSDSPLPFQNKSLTVLSVTDHEKFNSKFFSKRSKKEDVDQEIDQMEFKTTSPIPKARIFTRLIIPTVKISLSKWRNSTIGKSIKVLSDFHFGIILDNAYVRSIEATSYFSRNIPVWNPFHPIIMFMKLVSFLLLLLLFFVKPLEIAYYKELKVTTMRVYSILFLYYFLVEIFIKLNTGYFLNGLLVNKRLSILKNYCIKYLFSDFLTMVILFLDYKEAIHSEFPLCFHFMKLIVLVKGRQFKDLYRDALHHFKIEHHLKNLVELIELLYVTLLMAHIIACLWRYAALISIEIMNDDRNWLHAANLNGADWKIQYLYSLYWAVVAMMTVGFGDITPRNPIEVSFCIIIILVGCALYGYNLNSIGLILQRIYKEQTQFNEEIRIIENFMVKKNIDSDLHTRIKEYLKFIWNEKKLNHNDKELEIINSLSSTLKEELLLESYGGIIKGLPALHRFFSEKTLKKMVSLIKEAHFIPGDKIFIVHFNYFHFSEILKSKFIFVF